MGNYLKNVRDMCTQCLEVTINKKKSNDSHYQIPQHVNITKNPSSELSGQENKHQLSRQFKFEFQTIGFSIDNQEQGDQSYDFSKEIKPVDDESSRSATQLSAKQSTSPSKTDMDKSPQKINRSPQKTKDDDAIIKARDAQFKLELQKQSCTTEESPMLQEECKSEPFSERSNNALFVPEILISRDEEAVQDIGKRCLKQFKEILLQDQLNYETISTFDGGYVQDKFIQTPEKTFIHQIKFKFSLNTTLQKFIAFSMNTENQLKVFTYLEQYDIIDQFKDCALIQARYKKILLIEPKEYLYVKYFEEYDDLWYEVTQSIEIPDIQSPTYSPSSPKPVQRGKIILSGLAASKKNEQQLEIEGYLEIDVKIMLNPNMTKKSLAKESKETIDKIKKFFSEQE